MKIFISGGACPRHGSMKPGGGWKKCLARCRQIFYLMMLLHQDTPLAAQSVSLSLGEAPVPVVAPSVRVEFDTTSDKFYRIESSEDLLTWKPEGYAFAGNGKRMSALVSNHGLPRLFYRIRNNATQSEVAPIIPYGSVARSEGIASAPLIAGAEVDLLRDKLLIMDASAQGNGLRSVHLHELTKIPGFASRWGSIQGSIADQADLMSALNERYSRQNPPQWQGISGRPTTLLGYGITDAVSTSSIGFMDRFSRYPENSELSTGRSLPEYGPAWRFNIAGRTRNNATTISVEMADSSFNDSANGFLAQGVVVGDWLATAGYSNTANNGRFRVTNVSAGKINVIRDDGKPALLVNEAAGGLRDMDGGSVPFVSNGALRAADKTLIYIGAPTRTVNRRFSMTMEVELKPSVYPNGIFPASITIGIKPSALLAERGGITLGHLIHCQLNEAGMHSNEIYGQPQPFTWDGGGKHPLAFSPGKYFQRNGKYLIQTVVEGEEMRITALGGTIIYRDPRIATMIGDPETHWFYETGGDSLGNNLYRNVWHLHRIWVNAPELDRAEGWGLASTSNGTSQPTVIQSPTGVASSPTQVLGTAGTKTQLATITPATLPQIGAHQCHTIHGNFPNSNDKTLTLQVNGRDIWSSGNLSEQGEWTLEVQRVRQDANNHQTHVRFASETSRRFGYHLLNATQEASPLLELKGTASQNGDVIIRSVLHGEVNR